MESQPQNPEFRNDPELSHMVLLAKQITLLPVYKSSQISSKLKEMQKWKKYNCNKMVFIVNNDIL